VRRTVRCDHRPDQRIARTCTEDTMRTAVNLRVGNLMTLNPVTIGPEESAGDAEQLLKAYRISGLPVVADGVVVGVLSQTDLLTAHSSELIAGNWPRLKVRHLMTTPALTIRATASIESAARLMLEHHIHRLVVIDEDETPIGVITPLDLLRALLDEAEVA
jgi:IMP dehydrogenase